MGAAPGGKVLVTSPLEVGERIIALLDEGLFTATYKYAVLVGLLDLSLEQGAEVGAGSLVVTTRQLAEKVLASYWPQVRPMPFHQGVVPRQNGRGNRDARIVRIIDAYDPRGGRQRPALAEVRARDPSSYRRLVTEVERVLIEMPLPRLQSVGASNEPFLYTIGWDADVSRAAVSRYLRDGGGDFDNRIELRPGVAAALVELNGLLRPLIQRSWALKVAQLNDLDESKLHDFLFGQERTALLRVKAPLAELQEGRCFYCDGRLVGRTAVDHFLPWARVPNDNLENLVVTHAECNAAKRDFLPGLAHVRRWRPRCEDSRGIGRMVAGIAVERQWPTHPAATLGAARSIYARLPGTAKLWVAGREFEERGSLPLAL